MATRVFAAIEAASGFGLFALVISLLFSLFSSFQKRETAVVALDALAGAPPSGVQLLETCAKDAMPHQLVATFEEWRLWTVDVIESHLSYPLLFYFRSSHDNEAWANSFGAVLDAATLVLTTIDGGPVGNARLMHKVGAHLIADMRDHFRIVGEPVAGVEREEFWKRALVSSMPDTSCTISTAHGRRSARCAASTDSGSTRRPKASACRRRHGSAIVHTCPTANGRRWFQVSGASPEAPSRRSRRIDGRAAVDSAGNASRCPRARSARRMIARPG